MVYSSLFTINLQMDQLSKYTKNIQTSPVDHPISPGPGAAYLADQDHPSRWIDVPPLPGGKTCAISGIVVCTPLPTYPYGKSLYSGYLWILIPKNP